MADTDALRPYSPKDYPKLDGNDPRFIMDELRKLSASFNAVRSVMMKLEARIVALGG
jgi:hypothetical protein